MPGGQQKRDMSRFAGSCRFVYNKALALQKEHYESQGKKHSYSALCKRLTQWRARGCAIATVEIFRAQCATRRYRCEQDGGLCRYRPSGKSISHCPKPLAPLALMLALHVLPRSRTEATLRRRAGQSASQRSGLHQIEQWLRINAQNKGEQGDNQQHNAARVGTPM